MKRRFFSLLPRTVRRVAFLTLLVACGSRTGLFVDESFGPNPIDAGPDARRDGGTDAEVDALPPIDARPPADVDRRDCVDAGQTFIYVITTQYDLYSFNPPDAAFKLIGNIKCPAGTVSGQPATPFSMAVDRKGVAFVLFNDERLYRVSTLTAACIATSYAPRQSNFGLFGMGFTTIGGGPAEALYIAGDDQDRTNSGPGAGGLARIDPITFKLTPIASDFSPPIERAELTGTGDGRLFAFYDKGSSNGEPPTYIGEVDPDTGSIFAEAKLNTVGLGQGWAFAFWGGDFYTFTSVSQNQSQVHRYQPSNGSVGQIATLPRRIVGAGVSTCAPQE